MYEGTSKEDVKAYLAGESDGYRKIITTPDDTKTLKLSDSFQAPPKENSLELVVKFVNLNYNVLVTASAKRQRMQS